jgi:hypothetical protein
MLTGQAGKQLVYLAGLVSEGHHNREIGVWHQSFRVSGRKPVAAPSLLKDYNQQSIWNKQQDGYGQQQYRHRYGSVLLYKIRAILGIFMMGAVISG